jgi:hypothetical protein
MFPAACFWIPFLSTAFVGAVVGVALWETAAFIWRLL